jgi:hypothetical protein
MRSTIDNLSGHQCREILKKIGRSRQVGAFSDDELRAILMKGGIGPLGGGAVGAMSMSGMPAAAGGVDVSAAITSVVPGIRKLKKIAITADIPAQGGVVRLTLPKSSYWQKGTIRVSGNVAITQPGSLQAITYGDPRLWLQRMEFSLSGSTAPRVLTGLQADIIDNLDVPAVSPNKQTFTGGQGVISTTTNYPYAIEWSPRFTVSDQNLYGIPYLGAPGTVPQLSLTFGRPDQTFVTVGGTGASAAFSGGKVELEMWRVDLPSPIAPQTIVSPDGKTTQEIPGQGLYHESSYVLISRLQDAQDLTSAGTIKKFRLPAAGPDYLRMILMVYKNNLLDDETAPLMDHADITVQQATSIESKYIWQFDNEYRQTYNKARPTGVYVFSGIDLTGSDSDIYVTRDLGNFDIDWYGSANAPGANSRVECITQSLLPLSSPGQYL